MMETVVQKVAREAAREAVTQAMSDMHHRDAAQPPPPRLHDVPRARSISGAPCLSFVISHPANAQDIYSGDPTI